MKSVRTNAWVDDDQGLRAVRLDALTGQPRAICTQTDTGYLRDLAPDSTGTLITAGTLGRSLEEAKAMCDQDLEKAGFVLTDSLAHRLAELEVETTLGMPYETARARGLVDAEGKIDAAVLRFGLE